MIGWIAATVDNPDLRHSECCLETSTMSLKDRACIVGIGETPYTRGARQSVIPLVVEAGD